MIVPQPVPIYPTDPNFTGAPMAYMPPTLINGPQNFVYIPDPMAELAASSGAVICQQVDMFQAMTGCQTQNRYHVFLQTPMGLKYAFKCSERSGCCARCCCSGECRSMQMVVRHVISLDQLEGDLAKIFLRIDKPCKMGCCCLCRPYMDIRLADNGKYLGKVRQTCTCCDEDYEIYNAKGHMKYKINGDCCQVGFCCGSSGQKMSNIYFSVLQNGVIVGEIKKLRASWGEYFTKADSYQVTFPANATPEEKMVLIMSGLMIDYQVFENDDNVPHNYAY